MSRGKLSELQPGNKRHAAIARRVIAVLSIGHDGYRVYLDAVPGQNHDDEWQAVAEQGAKQLEPIARVIAETRFGFEVDLPYAA